MSIADLRPLIYSRGGRISPWEDALKRPLKIAGSILLVAFIGIQFIDRARKFVNFSDWQSLPPLYQQAIRQNILRVNASHKMPLWHYVTLHPDAKLSDNDRKILAQWAASGATQ